MTGGEASATASHWLSMMTDHDVRDGTVVEFDEHVGLGRIDSSGEEFLFHCVEILDGSRRISVGSPVRFAPVTRFGHREARAIEKLT